MNKPDLLDSINKIYQNISKDKNYINMVYFFKYKEYKQLSLKYFKGDSSLKQSYEKIMFKEEDFINRLKLTRLNGYGDLFTTEMFIEQYYKTNDFTEKYYIDLTIIALSLTSFENFINSQEILFNNLQKEINITLNTKDESVYKVREILVISKLYIGILKKILNIKDIECICDKDDTNCKCNDISDKYKDAKLILENGTTTNIDPVVLLTGGKYRKSRKSRKNIKSKTRKHKKVNQKKFR